MNTGQQLIEMLVGLAEFLVGAFVILAILAVVYLIIN